MVMERTYIDDIYPHMETPRILLHSCEVMTNAFRKELKKYQPQLFEWSWKEGIEIKIAERPEEDFLDKANFWINQKYRIGTGRIVESLENSWAVNWCDLGDGFRIHYGGFNPLTKTREYKHIMLIDFLYRREVWGGRYNSNGDLIENAGNGSGTRKLREFVKYLEQMPGCPYNWVIIHPAGSELTDLYSLHLQSVGYRKTGHTTEDLLKMYKYWLKAKKTKLKAMDFGIEDEGYWRLDCFNPVDPMYEPSSCPFANLLE